MPPYPFHSSPCHEMIYIWGVLGTRIGRGLWRGIGGLLILRIAGSRGLETGLPEEQPMGSAIGSILEGRIAW